MALPDKSTFATLGGEIVDYSAVEDPTTDLAAEFSNEVRSDVAAMTRMIPRAYVAFTTDGTTCTVVDHDAVWGGDLAVKPIVTVDLVYGATYVVTWPTTITDARGVVRALNLRRGLANVESGGFVASTMRRSANSISVTTASVTDGSLSAPPDAVTVVAMWAW